MQFLYLPVSSVAGNFPAIAAAEQVQRLLPLRDSPEVIKVFKEVCRWTNLFSMTEHGELGVEDLELDVLS